MWRLGSDASPSAAAQTEGGFVGYVVTEEGAVLSADPGQPGVPVAGGMIFPVTLATNGDYEVLDNCNRPGWIPSDQVVAGTIPTERQRQMDRSVFVIDPGHGAPDLGAVGPSGLTEAEANLDVSARVVELLGSGRDIDWTTGAVTPGSAVPAAAVAIMTRYPNGPDGGDYELGLTFRAAMGNAVDATALVSIHHNTEPTIDLDHPGTSAIVSATNSESQRLGSLMLEEVRRSFSGFEADWVGGQGNGMVVRVGADGDDYYTLLARSEEPAAIVEGAYISNPSEEALIMTDSFRQAYAEGVYRALVRFVTTDDFPIPAPEPELFDVEAPPRSMDNCIVPR